MDSLMGLLLSLAEFLDGNGTPELIDETLGILHETPGFIDRFSRLFDETISFLTP